MIALRRLRQPPVGGRFDLQPAVARPMTGARIVVSDIGKRIDKTAAIDGRGDMTALGKSPIALDHRIGCVDAVNDDGHAGAAGNDDVEAAAGKSR